MNDLFISSYEIVKAEIRLPVFLHLWNIFEMKQASKRLDKFLNILGYFDYTNKIYRIKGVS